MLCVGPTSLIALGGPLVGLTLFTIANFAYHAGAHLLRRVAQARQHPGDARPDVGHRRGHRVLRHGVRRAADLPPRHPGRRLRFALAAVLYGLFAIPIFLVVKEPRDPDAPPITVGDFLASWAQLRLTIAHARQVPGLSRFLLGRFFYSDAVNTVIVVMSVVAVKAVGFTRGRRRS